MDRRPQVFFPLLFSPRGSGRRGQARPGRPARRGFLFEIWPNRPFRRNGDRDSTRIPPQNVGSVGFCETRGLSEVTPPPVPPCFPGNTKICKKSGAPPPRNSAQTLCFVGFSQYRPSGTEYRLPFPLLSGGIVQSERFRAVSGTFSTPK